jgi:3-oxoacyl-[acyl-carrier-protein] synthase II
MRALSTSRCDDPASASRPFDSERDGFVFAEGAGMLIFEEMHQAIERNAKIYAEVIGFGTSCDAGHITQPDGQGRGAARAMELAIEYAQIDPTEIDYINAHGTSTPLGDIAETRAVKTIFGDSAYDLAISSTKSQMGHSLGASGGIELVLSIMTMRMGEIPPTINLEFPDPECDLDYTPNKSRSTSVNCVMSNSFGFGGHNASVIVKKFEA